MTRIVEVRTGARLHFGLFGTQPSQGRLGGMGLMVDRPGYVLRGWIAQDDAVKGNDDHAVERVRSMLWNLAKLRTTTVARRGIEPVAVDIEISRSMPAHHGFGSGTQLAFALADLLTALGVVTIDDPSNTFGRGRRSVVGSLGYSEGGFIVDYGDASLEMVLRRIEMACIPESWRFVVVDPQSGHTWSGDSESDAFRALPPMSDSTRDDLVQLARDSILLRLYRYDFEGFASNITAFNRLVGEHFSSVQGGVYAHPLVRELACTLADTDWPHLAQSSWGPAAVVFCEHQHSAEELHAFLNRRLPPDAADVFIAEPKNDGASLTIVEE